MKGYFTFGTYYGWVPSENKYMEFPSEEEYIEYFKENEE